MLRPTLTLTLLGALFSASAFAECNAEAVDYAVATQLANSRCEATKAKKTFFGNTYYVYATCLDGSDKAFGAYLYYDADTCLRVSED